MHLTGPEPGTAEVGASHKAQNTQIPHSFKLFLDNSRSESKIGTKCWEHFVSSKKVKFEYFFTLVTNGFLLAVNRTSKILLVRCGIRIVMYIRKGN